MFCILFYVQQFCKLQYCRQKCVIQVYEMIIKYMLNMWFIDIFQLVWWTPSLIYASIKWFSFGPDNGLSSGRHQAIIWTKVGILLIWPWETNFSEMLMEMQTFLLKKMHLKLSSAKWRKFFLSGPILPFKRAHTASYPNKTHKKLQEHYLIQAIDIHW